MAGDERDVEINLKAIGPSPPSSIRIPSLVKVSDLRSLVSLDRKLPKDRLKLILRGKILNDKGEDDEDLSVRFDNGDSLIVAVMPKPPAKHLQEDDDEDDDLRFQIPQSSSRWKKRVISFLREKLRLPDILLLAIFSIRLKTWACIFLWFALAPVAHRWDLGPLYIIGTGFLIILLNLGKRQQGDVRKREKKSHARQKSSPSCFQVWGEVSPSMISLLLLLPISLLTLCILDIQRRFQGATWYTQCRSSG